MCGRYASFLPAEALAEIFGTANPPPDWEPSWNLAPTQSAPVIRLHPQTGERHLDLLRWGLVPHWSKDPKAARQPINARAETAATLPIFRDAMARRHCLVPVDAFYEWQALDGSKQPWAIARADGATMALAGLWEGWRGADGSVIRSFTILTTAASAALRPLHERMPVVLEPADWAGWLDPAGKLPPVTAGFRTWQVSAAVNNVRNNSLALLEPV